MKIILSGNNYKYEIENVVSLFLYEKHEVINSDNIECEGNFVFASKKMVDDKVYLCVKISLNGKTYQDRASLLADIPNLEKECEFTLARMIYKILAEVTNLKPAWGILTGIRPVKFLREMIAGGVPEDKAKASLKDNYYLTDEKIDLAINTYQNEQKIIEKSDSRSFSLYVSIPFCPTRCSYCSFISHDVKGSAKLIEPYVEYLCKEIEHTGKIAKDLGLSLKTVYFGGGTPTSISDKQLAMLFSAIEKSFDLSGILEYTVEAGRPDTITREKLMAIHNAGVSRISINPQTFSDDILKIIGRRHTADDVIKAYDMATSVGLHNINMDLIAGLPTDTIEGFKNTLNTAISLNPSNITVHTMTFKRSSELTQKGEFLVSPYDMTCSEMVSYSNKKLAENGYNPYYLYRQKGTRENLENVGYCKGENFGYYNVFIMDETHTILAVGAGAVTKMCEPNGSKIERIFNYKFPLEYIKGFDEMLKRKNRVIDFYDEYKHQL